MPKDKDADEELQQWRKEHARRTRDSGDLPPERGDFDEGGAPGERLKKRSERRDKEDDRGR